jgi:hypothetical protein
MNKFIILVLALLCASTFAFRVRQGGPPPQCEGEECEELDFPCKLPAEDATEEALDEFMACLDEAASMFDDIEDGACGALPGLDATEEEAHAWSRCIDERAFNLM